MSTTARALPSGGHDSATQVFAVSTVPEGHASLLRPARKPVASGSPEAGRQPASSLSAKPSPSLSFPSSHAGFVQRTEQYDVISLVTRRTLFTPSSHCSPPSSSPLPQILILPITTKISGLLDRDESDDDATDEGVVTEDEATGRDVATEEDAIGFEVATDDDAVGLEELLLPPVPMGH